MQALVLLGHGSHISPATAGVVWECVDRLRLQGAADEVTAAFWKEMPYFSQVLNTLMSEEVILVPVFTSQGYFTRSVIPAELNLSGPASRTGRRRIRYARTIGESARIGHILERRVREGLASLGASEDQTAVVIIGHGTVREQQSRAAAEQSARLLQQLVQPAEILTAYLDDDPPVGSVFERCLAPNLIAVPLFVAFGSHVTYDIPAALGLSPGSRMREVDGRMLYYTAPVGLAEDLVPMVMELAEEAGLARKPEHPSDPWSGIPAAGRKELADTLQTAGSMRLGQLHVSTRQVEVWGDSGPREEVQDPTRLRHIVRGRPFRPLATSLDLPGGWLVRIEAPEQAQMIVETIYPGLAADWAQHNRGRFQAGTFENTIGRQQGRFRALAELSAADRLQASQRICSGCVRHPSWLHGQTPNEALPCAEPCNWWLTQVCREA